MYNSTKLSTQPGFFFIELSIACCLLILIATIIAQCQMTIYKAYHEAIRRMDSSTKAIFLAEEFIQNGEIVSSHDLTTIESIAITYSYFPGEPIKATIIHIREKNKEVKNEHEIITGIFNNE